MELIENVIWYATLPLILIVSAFFTVYAKMPQFRIRKIIAAFKSSDSNEKLSPVATLFIALSARVGVGTLAGTGLAIAIGGAGAIFWMWISAIILAAATFAENTLSQRFKQTSSGKYYGGPAFYIKYGLKNTKLSILYAVVLVITYTLGFVAIQMNTLTTVFTESIGMPPIITSLILSVLTMFIITGNITHISTLIAKIVPFIAMLFLGLATVTIIINITYIPNFFNEIITGAFGLTPFAGGGLGLALVTGIRRGVFSNEAGIGTGAHAAALTHHNNPKDQGYIGILGIYLTTLISVTLVAFMIMSTGAHNNVIMTGNGIEFLQFSLHELFGRASTLILPIIIFFFGFSTVITAYLYGVINVKFLSRKKTAVTALRVVLLVVILIASVSSSRIIWHLVDIGVGITAMINLIAIIMLRKYVKKN